MKKFKLILALALPLLLGTTACNKEAIVKQNNGKQSIMRAYSSDITVTDEGIPRYANMDVYEQAYATLQDEMAANSYNLAVEYADITTDDETNADIAWEVWDKTFLPLRDFENSIGFESKSKEDYENEKDWLNAQGEELNTETYPELTGVGIIEKTLMNKDGNFIIGEDLYHVEPDLKTVKVLGWVNLGTASKTYIGQIFDAMWHLEWGEIEDLFAQLDDHVTTNTTRDSTPLSTTCKTNRKDGFWVDVDSKTKYAQHSSLAYDLIKTSAYHEIRAYAKVLKKWVPALTNLKAGIQLYHKKSGDCSELASALFGEDSFKGSFAFIQGNYWGSQRAIEKPKLNSNNSYPGDGFYGSERVKNMGTKTWSPLRLTY